MQEIFPLQERILLQEVILLQDRILLPDIILLRDRTLLLDYYLTAIILEKGSGVGAFWFQVGGLGACLETYGGILTCANLFPAPLSGSTPVMEGPVSQYASHSHSGNFGAKPRRVRLLWDSHSFLL